MTSDLPARPVGVSRPPGEGLASKSLVKVDGCSRGNVMLLAPFSRLRESTSTRDDLSL
jgi:hypothetical protein